MKCKFCRYETSEDLEVCPKCRAPLDKSIESKVEEIDNSNIITEEPKVDSYPQIKPSTPNNKKKSKLPLIILIIVIIIGLIVVLKPKDNNNQQKEINKPNKTDNKTTKNEDENNIEEGIETISYNYQDSGTLRYANGKFSNTKVKSSKDALKALEDIKDKLKFKDANKEFKLAKEDENQGIKYYRFNQIYNGIEVYNNNIIISVDKDGNVLSFSGYYIPNINISTTPKKTEKEIKEIVTKNLGGNAKILEIKKCIDADNTSQKLVYIVTGNNDIEIKEYIIDANTGEIISKIDLNDSYTDYTYIGEGIDGEKHTINIREDKDLFQDNYYIFVDSNRKIALYDARGAGPIFSSIDSLLYGQNDIYAYRELANSSFGKDNFTKTAVTTMKNYEDIYDYYKNVLGRDSFDDKGSRIIVYLGVVDGTLTEKELGNAMWTNKFNVMLIGDYKGKSLAISKDILAHELTHGVISYTAQFASRPKEEDENKAFETGALNEAIADILGCLIEGNNWEIGENTFKGTDYVRDLTNPIPSEQPAVKGGEYYFPDHYLKNKTLEELIKINGWKTLYSYDGGGKHHNSTVISHTAYLMYNNGAFSSKDEMAKVWYNALFLMPSYASFEDCASAVIKSAQNLGLSEDKVKIITDAFIETKVLEEKSYNMSGTVKDGKQVLKDVNVSIYNLDENKTNKADYNIKTDKDGNFSIKLKQGTYKLIFEKDGYEQSEKKFTITGDTIIFVPLTKKSKSNPSNKDNFVTYYKDSKFISDLPIKVSKDGVRYQELSYKNEYVENSSLWAIIIIYNDTNETLKFETEICGYKNGKKNGEVKSEEKVVLPHSAAPVMMYFKKSDEYKVSKIYKKYKTGKKFNNYLLKYEGYEFYKYRNLDGDMSGLKIYFINDKVYGHSLDDFDLLEMENGKVVGIYSYQKMQADNNVLCRENGGKCFVQIVDTNGSNFEHADNVIYFYTLENDSFLDFINLDEES